MDASKRVHDEPDIPHNPMRRNSTRFDENGVDYIGNNEDTSVKRVPPPRHPIHTAGHRITMPTASVLAVDVSKHVYNSPNAVHNPMRRQSTHLDDDYVDYHEDTRDTSLKRVPTFIPAVDVPKHAHNASDDSHNVAHRRSMRSDAHCVDYIEDTEDTSVRRVPPSDHPVHTAGRRTMTSTAHLPTVDVSEHVHNLPNTSYNLTRRKSTRFDDDCIDYQGDVKDTSYGRVPPFLPTVNVSKHVHNVSDDPHNLTHRRSTRLDPYHVDLIENTEDTSYGRASTNLPTTDALKRVCRPPTSLYGPMGQCTSRMTRFDISSNTDHQENNEDTSLRRVPSTFPPLAARRRIMTSATCPLAVDVSRRVRNLSVDAYEPTRQGTTHDDVSSSITYQRNDEVEEDMSYRRVSSSYLPPPTSGRRIMTSTTVRLAMGASKHAHYLPPRLYESMDQRSKCLNVFPDGDHQEDTQDTSLRRVPSSHLCPPTYGHRITMPITSTSTKDVSRHVSNLPDGSYGLTHPSLRHSNVPPDIDRQDTSIRRVSLTSDAHELDVQDDWEERINLICMEYGLTKPHRQAQYWERATKIVNEFADNEPEKLARGSSKYYDTIIKTFTRLAKKYRQNRDSKRLGSILPSSVDVSKHVHNTEDTSYGRVPSSYHSTSGCCITTSTSTAWPTADMLNCVRNPSTGYGSTHPDVMRLDDEGMSLRHLPSSRHHQITPERHTATFTTISFADRLNLVRKLPAPYGPIHPFLRHSQAPSGADHHRDSKDTSSGHVPSPSHSAPIIECRTSTPIPGSEEVMHMMTNIMIRQCVTDIERHRSFIKDALKSMQGEWSQKTIVLAFEHLDKLIKEYKAVLKTKRLQLAVTYSQTFKENQISLSKSESKNELSSLPQSLETAAKSSKIVRGRNVDNFEHSRFVARPIVGLPHESSISLASERRSESALSWRSHRAPTLGSWRSHHAPTLGSWRSHHAPTLGSWRSQRAPAICASNGQGEHVSTDSPSDTISLWRRDVAENVDSPISLEEIRPMTTSKSNIEDLDRFTNEDSMPQDSSDESVSSEPSRLPPSEVDPSYQVELIVEVPSSMVENNHALALVQVLPPDTELSDVPDCVDIYHITITDDSVIGEDPPPSDGSHEDHNYDEEASSLRYDSNQEVLDEEDAEDYNHDHDYGYDPDPPYEDHDSDPPAEDYDSDPPGEDFDPDPPGEDNGYDSCPLDEDFYSESSDGDD